MSFAINIFSRSPYTVTIDEEDQEKTMLKIYIVEGAGSYPASPNYTLSKIIPASNNPATYYNTAPYLNEFINPKEPQNPTGLQNLNTNMFCKYEFAGIYFKTISTPIGPVLYPFFLTGLIGYAFKGYTKHEDGYNYDYLTNVLLDEGTYYYLPNGTFQGELVLTANSDYSEPYAVRYTDLVTEDTYTLPCNNNNIRCVPKIHNAFNSNGNKVEVLDDEDVVIKTFYFRPITECKYEPYRVDFIDKFGVWNFLWFFKASNESISVESKDYNLMQSNVNYDPVDGVKKEFNKNGQRSFKVNSGWVEEETKVLIEELFLSERILLNGLPAILKTKSTELFKHINTNQINYQLEFDLANPIINTLV